MKLQAEISVNITHSYQHIDFDSGRNLLQQKSRSIEKQKEPALLDIRGLRLIYFHYSDADQVFTLSGVSNLFEHKYVATFSEISTDF